jgi:hypothetical protein
MASKGSTTISLDSREGPTWPRWTGWGSGNSRMDVSPPNHEIVVVPFGGEGDELRQGCYSVRINVFHHEQGFSLEADLDELRLIWPHRRHRPLLWSRVIAYFRLHTD